MNRRYKVMLRPRGVGTRTRVVIEASSPEAARVRIRELRISAQYDVISIVETDEALTPEFANYTPIAPESEGVQLSERELLERINYNLYILASRPRLDFWTIMWACVVANLVTAVLVWMVARAASH